MFCSKCGTQLPDEANFCWKCGQPTKAEVSGDAIEVCQIIRRYETDQNLLGRITGHWFWFEAICRDKVIAKSQEYDLGKDILIVRGFLESEDSYMERMNMEQQIARDRFDQFLKGLEKDGWEPVYDLDGTIKSMKRQRR